MRASGRSDLSSAFGGAIKGRIADLLGSHGGRFDGLGSSFAKLFRRKAFNHYSGKVRSVSQPAAQAIDMISSPSTINIIGQSRRHSTGMAPTGMLS